MNFSKKSPWILHYDGTSCNGCDIEVLACLTPLYDVERFGLINTGNPKHADILLITGSINEQSIPVVKQLYEQMADPKVVIAVGICAARPESIIDGVVKALSILEEKQKYARTKKIV